ncbi:MAG: DUF1491 family protein [Sphingorhabdus sp.]
MTEPRLASSVQVSAFIRLAELGGDFATVLRKGDPVAGAILLIGLVRGENPRLFERFPLIAGGSPWQQMAKQPTENETEITERWKKRAASDPDLWVIELDVAMPERLDLLLASAY